MQVNTCFSLFGHLTQVDASQHKFITSHLYLRDICNFLRLAWTCESVWPLITSLFASLVLQICVNLQQLASPFGQGLTQMHILGWIKTSWKPNFEQESLTSFLHHALQRQIAFTTLNSLPCHLHGLASAKRNKYKTRVNPSNMIPITINHLKQTNKRLTVSLKIKIPASEKRVAKWWLLFRWRNVLKSEE